MDRIKLFFVILLLPAYISGTIISFSPLENINIYLIDLIALFLFVLNLLSFKKISVLIKKDNHAKFFLLFLTSAFFSLLLSPIQMNLNERFTAFLYTVRIFIYFSVYLTFAELLGKKLLKTESINKGLVITGITLSGIGWIQYFLYPDLRNLYYLGWDPHNRRIFSTFLDPNFFGLIPILTSIILLSFKPQILRIFTISFLFLTLLFTYSRGSILAFGSSAFSYLLLKRKLMLLIPLTILFALSLYFLPRPPGSEGVKLERFFSVKERAKSWQEGINLILKYPIFGIGFNALRYTKTGNDETGIPSHSSAGIDNSFIFVGATTGLIGLIVFLAWLFFLFKELNVIGKISLITVIIHSLFQNSFFYSFIFIWFLVVLSIKLRNEGKN